MGDNLLNDTEGRAESEHKDSVISYYDHTTEQLFIDLWSSDHIHFGLFEPGECPPLTSSLTQGYTSSTGLRRALERMIDVIVEPVGIVPDSHVVDAGCGIGGTALYLAKTRRCRVSGINVNRKQLEIARQKVRQSELHHLVCVEYANCSEYLPFADNSIDVVVNIESACYYDDRQQFLREVYRILKPGGVIAATDWMSRDRLSPDQYEKYIQPLCNSWFMLSLENQSSYTRKLQDARLQVEEFKGFGGRDNDNVKILENIYQKLLFLYFQGIREPAFLENFERFSSLYQAWINACFELRRYFARKPKSR